MLSGDVCKGDLGEDWLQTDADRDNSVIGYITSPTYVIMHLRRQQVRTKRHLFFTSLRIFFWNDWKNDFF